MTPIPPQAAPADAALAHLYAVATAGEAGTSVRTVAAALLERLARATGAERALLAIAPDGDDPGGVMAAWDADAEFVPPPAVNLPDAPGSLAAAVALPGAVVIPLVARDRPVGWVVLGGDVDRDAAARLAVPGALALDAARRAEQAAARAERADRLSSLTRDLMSIVSHELRTPLTSVIGSLQTLQRTGVDPAGPEGRRLLASALSRAERLRTLIDDLLVTARAEIPVRSRHRPMDPTEVVRSAIGSVPGAAPLVAVHVEARVGPVLLDRGHLERVLVNLIENAVRHGGGAADLKVARSEQRLLITIADRGPGLPPTIARAVLDRRHDSPDTALRPSGPGLGLTVTRSLVEGMEGTLRYETTPGGGATFVVELPYRDGR